MKKNFSKTDLQNEELSKNMQSVLIDWFRFVVFEKFDLNNPSNKLLELFNILKLDINSYYESERNDLRTLKYRKTLIYNEDLKVGIDVEDSGRVEGEKYQFIIEISGSGCRHFEMRGGSWQELLFFLLDKVRCRFKRIDIACDDIDGYLNIDDIKDKIYRQNFTSVFRGKKVNGKIGDEKYSLALDEEYEDDLDERNQTHIFDTRAGYTCTFGSRSSSILLNIYDKKAERSSKNIVSGVNSWIRFEFSLTKEKCEYFCKVLLKNAFLNNEFGKLSKSVLYGLIDFKVNGEYKRGNFRNLYKCSTWKPYLKFLGSVEKVRVPSDQSKIEESITKSFTWIKDYWMSTLLKTMATGDFNCYLKSFMEEYLDKHGIEQKIIFQIKNYFLSVTGEILNDDEIFELIKNTLVSIGCNYEKLFQQKRR